MSKKPKKQKNNFSSAAYTFVESCGDIKKFCLKNGLSIYHKNIPGTGVVTSNIVYSVGARDEQVGETGLAHMLEHMMFKQTQADKKNNKPAGSLEFERNTGALLNANTWKDRTTYYFSYPKKYFFEALQVEAERMNGLTIENKEFTPERNNVLSEFDMYFGNPYFALELSMLPTAFQSHPYGHETIGFREDIEHYTTAMLERFYHRYYTPSNASLVIVGDIDEQTVLTACVKYFGAIPNTGIVERLRYPKEPIQEGIRRIQIERQTTTNIVGIGVKHAGFPSRDWFISSLLAAVLTDGPDSTLHKELIDTGLATQVSMSVEPASETVLSILFVTFNSENQHEHIEKKVQSIVKNLTAKSLSKAYKKVFQKVLTAEVFGRESSLDIVHELTEYISAGSYKHFFKTEEILRSITPAEIVAHAQKIFTPAQTTVGYFIGKNQV